MNNVRKVVRPTIVPLKTRISPLTEPLVKPVRYSLKQMKKLALDSSEWQDAVFWLNADCVPLSNIPDAMEILSQFYDSKQRALRLSESSDGRDYYELGIRCIKIDDDHLLIREKDEQVVQFYIGLLLDDPYYSDQFMRIVTKKAWRKIISKQEKLMLWIARFMNMATRHPGVEWYELLNNFGAIRGAGGSIKKIMFAMDTIFREGVPNSYSFNSTLFGQLESGIGEII